MLDQALPQESPSEAAEATDVANALRELSASGRQFVQAAALVGDVFTLHEIARVQSVTTLSMLPALEETISAGLVRFAGDRLAFCSPGARRALHAGIPAPVRRTLLHALPGHRPAGQSSPGEPGSPDALVSVLFLSQDCPDRPLAPNTTSALGRALTETLAAADDIGTAATEAALIVSLFGQDEAGLRDRARAIVMTERPGAASVVAAVALSNLEWAAGQVDTALQWGREARHRGQDALPAAWRPYPALALAVKLIQLGHLTEGEAELAHSRDISERLRLRRARAETSIAHGRLLLGTGRAEAAEAELCAGVGLAQRIQAHLPAAQGLSLLSLLSLAGGNRGEAADQVWRARMELADQPGASPSLGHTWADFLVTTADMEARGRADLLVNRFPELLTKPSLFLRDPAAAAQLVRLALAADEHSLAAAVTRRVERLAEQDPGQPALAAAAGHAWGLLHRDRDALEYAAVEHRAPWAAAAASEDLGMLLLERDGAGSGTARRHLRAAADRYRATGWLAAAARLEPLVRQGRKSSPPHAGTAPARERVPAPAGPALTAAEQRIARLVAEGLTNKQVATRVSRSPHTVNYHLRQIFQKLGVASRVELARLVN
ncbi:LuxR C-terminal-related transcriptional regulator [Streptomyces sp. NPDC060184]|uniref:LuxR C-terminal-related transcriptional regulator n=1 Tax=Streptomyces sp. NPDC060184 TaxID=3347064 RepID=UPI003657924B